MTKICICGHFGGNKEFYDGQTIKTKNIYSALEEHYGKNEMSRLDTYNWKKKPIKFLFECIKELKNSENMIILPAHNGVKMFVPLFVFLNKFYHKKVFYVVIGGWLPELLKARKILTKKIRKLDRIFVETQFMKKKLHELNVDNVDILYNFKNIKPINKEDIKCNHNIPLRLCIFSRISEEKGINDAIKVIDIINKENKEIMCTLDIYGKIDKNFEVNFYQLIGKYQKQVKYMGVAESNKSVEIIQKYDVLLFPTKSITEGLPGTIIDAYCAGVPVIASNWNSAREFILDNQTGLIYNFNDLDDFKEKLNYAIKNINLIEKMKGNCIDYSVKFTKEKIINQLIELID